MQWHGVFPLLLVRGETRRRLPACTMPRMPLTMAKCIAVFPFASAASASHPGDELVHRYLFAVLRGVQHGAMFALSAPTPSSCSIRYLMQSSAGARCPVQRVRP